VVLVPIALVGGDVGPTGHDLAWLLVLGLVHTALALAIFLGGLGRIPALHTGVLAYLEPASATFLGWLVLGEVLGVGTVLGGVLVVVGGLLVLGAPGVDEPTVTPEAPGSAVPSSPG
jgi:drug/metabolite transporter (DMT)-like permease